MLLLNILIFILSTILLIKCANWLTGAAIEISHFFGLPKAVIGATVIALATTLPETLTSFMSGIRHHTDLGVGNALGSPATNLGLIMGLTLIFSHPTTKPYEIKQNSIIATTILIALSLFFFNKDIDATGATLLIITALLFLIYSGYKAYHHAGLHEKILAKFHQHRHMMEGRELRHILRELILAIIFLPIATYGITQSGIDLARFFHVPEFLIGFTLISLGTSLPELTIAITLFIKKHQDLSFGNLTGASILTLTLSLGTAILFEPFHLSRELILFTFPYLILIFLSTFLLLKKEVSPRFIGIILLILYGIYTYNNILIST